MMTDALAAALTQAPPAPRGNYRAVIIGAAGGQVSGQLPLRDGSLPWRGRLGAELDLQQGRAAAAQCARNVLSQLHAALGADLARLRLGRIDGYVAVADGFDDLAAVLDAASDLLLAALGERGCHARSAIGVHSLPGGAPVEIVASFSLEPAAVTPK